MDSSRLTKEQARIVNESLRPMLRYVGRLKSRMEELRFPTDDKLYRAIVHAYDGLHSAHIESHYLSVGQGVGRPSWIERMGGRREPERPMS